MLQLISKAILRPPKYKGLSTIVTKAFTSGKNSLSDVLASISVTVGGQSKNLLDSGILQSHSVDPNTNKVVLAVSATRNFPQLKNMITKSLAQKGYSQVEVHLAHKQDKKIFERKGNLKGIGKVIAVSSCKGGVGKSTVAVNLAYGLQQQGSKVGLFDADVYGPSLPTMVNLEGKSLQSSSENATNMLPLDANRVKCMSFGFVSNHHAATMRGPMASSIVSQLLLQTEWGELDYLVVDMPPGTGDINLSICEELNIDGALIVTTPQRLSFIDVLKGIKMFQDLRVRILGVVENMSYYSCSDCGTE